MFSNVSGGSSSKQPLSTVYKQYCELVEQSTTRITDHHKYLLVTVILHDAESNHWMDNKEFYEVS